MLRILLFNKLNERATTRAENTAIKQRPDDIYDAKLINYIHISCAGGILNNFLYKYKKLC